MTLQISLKPDTPNPTHTPPLVPLPELESSLRRSHKETGRGGTSTEKLDVAAAAVSDSFVVQEKSGRERLKRHRMAVAGQVWIPEKWGKEELLKDWIDGSAFEASLFPSPSGIVSARLALVREGKRANNNAAAAAAAAAGALRILNSC